MIATVVTPLKSGLGSSLSLTRLYFRDIHIQNQKLFFPKVFLERSVTTLTHGRGKKWFKYQTSTSTSPEPALGSLWLKGDIVSFKGAGRWISFLLDLASKLCLFSCQSLGYAKLTGCWLKYIFTVKNISVISIFSLTLKNEVKKLISEYV